MAEITETSELNIQLLNASGSISRVLKVESPKSTITTKAQVETALAPAFDTETGVYFFYDDGNEGGYEVPMVKVGTVEKVYVTKSVTKYPQGD